MTDIKFNIIVACDESYGIGLNGSVPWINTEIGRKDMRMFKKLTSATTGLMPVLIMGSVTYNSCGELPNRIKVLISSNDTTNNVIKFKSNKSS